MRLRKEFLAQDDLLRTGLCALLRKIGGKVYWRYQQGLGYLQCCWVRILWFCDGDVPLMFARGFGCGCWPFYVFCRGKNGIPMAMVEFVGRSGFDFCFVVEKWDILTTVLLWCHCDTGVKSKP